MNDYWSRLEDLFDELCALDEETGRRILDQRCDGDTKLRGDVERMLRAHREEGEANREARAAAAGRRFGHWQTVRLLARGGMGEVWLARRADGQHEQQAALKILSPYLAAADSVHRFRRERELLARLEHPNIARLLDGGMSAQGEPYLVMEYVEGVRLDRYCADRNLPVRERLQLFLKICAAVNAAHQYFVVHRDLKPGNILVTAAGEPKLLDFGIAKLIDVETGLEQTATANIFLTPMYASPEVLRGKPATVASDIYSLGVVFYELLAGCRPFDASKLSPAELMTAITERDAPPPAADDDLNAIALKALAKNPEERYSSAAQLAEDIRRHLNGQPVEAVRATWGYVARKFMRRNRLAVSAAAVLLVSLGAGIGGTLWQAHIARQERGNAEQRFNDVRQLANYLLFDLYDSVGKVPGTMPVQAEMAGRTLEYLDRLSAIRSSDPALRLELARGYLRLGTILGAKLGLGDNLGNNAKALELEHKALGIIEPLARERPNDLEIRRTHAAIQEQYGAALQLTGKYNESGPWLFQAAQTFDQIAQANPQDPRSLQDAGKGWQICGKLMSERGGYITYTPDVPLGYVKKSLQYFQTLLKNDPRNVLAIQSLAESYEAIGRMEAQLNPPKGAQDFRDAVNLLDKLPDGDRRAVGMQQIRARILVLLGWTQGQLGDFKGSLATLQQARPILDSQSAADPSNMGPAFRRVDLYRTMGLVEGYASHKKESLEYLQTATRIMDMIVERDTANTNYPLIRAELQGRVANLLLEAGRRSEAEPYARDSVAYFHKLGERSDATAAQLMECVRSLAETGIPSLHDYPTALRFALRADQISGGKNPAVLGYLSESYGFNKNYPKAVESAERGLKLTPVPKPGEPENRLRGWLSDELKEYRGKSERASAR
jgi:eukaryotic-like serine/threonine-protein kinase